MEKFDVCTVDFIYREDANKPEAEQRSKRRPCLVLSNNVVTPIAQITKHLPRTELDYTIKNFEEAGLYLPSTIRFGQTMIVNDSDLTKIGHLSAEDIEEINRLNLIKESLKEDLDIDTKISNVKTALDAAKSHLESIKNHPEQYLVDENSEKYKTLLDKYNKLIADFEDTVKQGEATLSELNKEKINLKEDLSQEEKTDYGLNTLINSLITDEYEAIDGYNSAIVTFEAEGKGEFTDVIRDIIKDEQNHIGNLQILLKEVQPDVLDNFEHGQGQAEQILDTDNTSDETELTESKEDKEWYGLVNHSDMTDIDFALVSKDKEELEKHWGDLLEITEGDIGELSSEEYFNTITGPKIEELNKIGVHFVDSEGGNTAPTGEYLDINEEGKISFKDKPLNILRKSHSRF